MKSPSAIRIMAVARFLGQRRSAVKHDDLGFGLGATLLRWTLVALALVPLRDRTRRAGTLPRDLDAGPARAAAL